ncbi:MAG: hydrogenase expression/formation protein HypE [Planctomycetaceae bacterium]|nr:hydrogenase expression/formation protein HypE [Planctomycetaceae bacterium]
MAKSQSSGGGIQCPLPLRDYPNVVLGHGGGGRLTEDLVRHLFLPAFQPGAAAALPDSAALTIGDSRLAFSTDSYVIRPLFFPGGCIGELAVNGTVNDLAMSGAQPLFLSAGFIIEEGFSLAALTEIAQRMGQAASAAGVSIVTGDTKVVERGHGDGCYINTSGIGVIPAGIELRPDQVCPGDAVILSGTIGDHGMAILSVREGLEFESDIVSDTAPLHELVAAILKVCPEAHAFRDPTRGGVAATLNEIAAVSQVGIELQEIAIPIQPAVRSACELLGLDPLSVANEGKLIAFVPADRAEDVVTVMRQHAQGTNACIVGQVTDAHPKMVVMRTEIGATRIVLLPIGEQLPRIC